MSIKVLNLMTGGLKREGIASTQLEFLKRFNIKKVSTDIAAVNDNSPEMIKEFENIGCKVIKLPERKKHIFRYMRELVKVMKLEAYDIVHIHGSSAFLCIELIASVMAGVPIRIVHSRNTRCGNEKLDKICRPIFNYLYTDAFACGIDAGKWLFGDKPFKVIHNGKDFSRFCYSKQLRDKERKLLGLEDKIVVGHVGRMNEQKNHKYLLEVFLAYHRKNKDSVLYLIGDGPLSSQLREQVKRMNMEESIFFVGSVPDVERYLQVMDIMVFPSKFEGLPNVVLEWQAEGLPCIISESITKECAPSELVQFMSIKENPEKWADKMVEILDKKSDRLKDSEHGIYALRKAGFDIEENAAKLEDIYIDLVNKLKK